jgi:hypothetical protein
MDEMEELTRMLNKAFPEGEGTLYVRCRSSVSYPEGDVDILMVGAHGPNYDTYWGTVRRTGEEFKCID